MGADRELDLSVAQTTSRMVRDAQRDLLRAVITRAVMAWVLHRDHGMTWRQIGALLNVDHGQLWTEVQRHVPDAWGDRHAADEVSRAS